MGTKYKELLSSGGMDLSEAALLRALGNVEFDAARIVELYINREWFVSARSVVAELTLSGMPYINIHISEEFSIDEWCVEYNGNAYGSKGA